MTVLFPESILGLSNNILIVFIFMAFFFFLTLPQNALFLR